MNTYPEHDKMEKVQHMSQAAGEFVEWLEQNGHVIQTWHPDDDLVAGGYFRSRGRLTCLLARWLDIDLNKIEQEKRDMLSRIREGRDV